VLKPSNAGSRDNSGNNSSGEANSGIGVQIKNEPIDDDKPAGGGVASGGDKSKSNSPPPTENTAPEHLVIPADPALMRGLDSSSIEPDGNDQQQAGPSNSSGSSSFVGTSQGEGNSSCICPVCQAVLSNRNVLHYHLKYVHAVESSYQLLSKVAEARVKGNKKSSSTVWWWNF